MSSRRMSEEVGYLLKEAQQGLRKKMDKALSEMDLTTPQFAVLAQLREFPGLSNAELARKSFVTPQTMNQIVQNLEARGIVKRVGSETHGKIMNTMITKVGLALLEKAKALVLAVEEEVFGRLSPAEIKSLSVLLKKLSERP